MSKNSRLVARAMNQLPDLNQLEQHLRDDPIAAAAPALQPSGGSHGGMFELMRSSRGSIEGTFETINTEETLELNKPEAEEVLEAGTRAVTKINEEGENAELTLDEQTGLEAIILVFGRPAILIQNGTFAAAPQGWEILEARRQIIESTFPSVGRIEEKKMLQGGMIGTGFLVADDVIMTNRHVARFFSIEGLSNNWKLKLGMNPIIDYVEEEAAASSAEFRITEVVGIHETLDLALLRVEKNSQISPGLTQPKPLSIASSEPDLSEVRKVYVVGYPATDNGGVTPPEVILRLFSSIFQVKRLQPGEIQAVFDEKPIMAHDCSTLGGNSGSAVFDLETGQVIGLHFRGEFRKQNHAVALWKLADDPLLKKAKVNFV